MDTPNKVQITRVVEVELEVNDDSIMPNRVIKQYWTLDGRMIGTLDPLDDYESINSAASETVNS